MSSLQQNIKLFENIIINIAYTIHNTRTICYCKEKDYKTIVVNMCDVKKKLQDNNIEYSDIEYLLYYTYSKRNLLSYLSCCLYKKQEILLLKYLRKRIKYQFFSKQHRMAKDIRILTADSGELMIIFDLKYS